MKKSILLISLLFFSSFCFDPFYSQNNFIISDSNKVDKPSSFNQIDTNFLEFLRQFKIALMVEDKTKIIDMTEFPFWYSYIKPNWRDKEEFLSAYDLIFETEAIQSILFAQLNQEIETNLLDGTVKVTKETNEEELTRLKKKFNIDSNVFYTLLYGYTVNPDRAIEAVNFYYFALTNDGFKLLGCGLL